MNTTATALDNIINRFEALAGETVTGAATLGCDGAIVLTLRFTSDAGIDRALAVHKAAGCAMPDARRPARCGVGPSLRWRFPAA